LGLTVPDVSVCGHLFPLSLGLWQGRTPWQEASSARSGPPHDSWELKRNRKDLGHNIKACLQ
jgi:hypothetical protein